MVVVSFGAPQVAPGYSNRTTEYFLDNRYKVRYSLSVLLHQNSISIYYVELAEGLPKTLVMLLTNGFV